MAIPLILLNKKNAFAPAKKKGNSREKRKTKKKGDGCAFPNAAYRSPPLKLLKVYQTGPAFAILWEKGGRSLAQSTKQGFFFTEKANFLQ